MANAYDQLLVVQELDTRADQLAHRYVHHPLRASIDELQAKRSAELAVVTEIDVERHEVERQRKRIDDEVATLRSRRNDIETKLYDGSVSGTKELLAMQEESGHLADRCTAMEDDELELMEQVEEIDGRLAPRRDAVEAFEREITATEAELGVALDEVKAEQLVVAGERVQAAAAVPPNLLSRYDQLRSDMGGIAIARLEHNTCSGCHLSLSAVESDKIRKLPDDAVVLCESCGRILIR